MTSWPLKHLKYDPDVLWEYNSITEDQVHHGIVELVELSNEDAEKIHYLLHHAVMRCNKETMKIRVVYDASARSEGPSLNECLHTRPKFNQRILDIFVAVPCASGGCHC